MCFVPNIREEIECSCPSAPCTPRTLCAPCMLAGDKALYDAVAHPFSVMGKASFFLGEVRMGCMGSMGCIGNVSVMGCT